ncbi:MAG: phytanoyl-CoA dioxygenase family protein [Ectothiorhodospiraceae bacterium]|nr:phytanoyl-CoA dioxygenase family protein [Ectothiorhodospiraceae bacterium]
MNETARQRDTSDPSDPRAQLIRSHWDRDGYVFPIDVLNEAEAREIRSDLEDAEAAVRDDAELTEMVRGYTNLMLPSFASLVRHPRIVEAVKPILGPDLLVWGCSMFIKEPQTRSYVSWHQDLNYWGLDGDREVTVWVALSPATTESGCMRFVPGSHKTPDLPHTDTFARDNLLSRGQEVSVEVDDSQGVDIVLATGQASLHHGHLLHASYQNRTDDRRIGAAIRYISPDMAQTSRARTVVTLVAGEDRFGHFELAPAPTERLSPLMVALCRDAIARKSEILYRDAKEQGRRRVV